jgi:hypothetical protein
VVVHIPYATVETREEQMGGFSHSVICLCFGETLFINSHKSKHSKLLLLLLNNILETKSKLVYYEKLVIGISS